MPTYRFADVTVRLCSLSPSAQAFLKEYRVDSDAIDEEFDITDTDLKAEACLAPTAPRGLLEVTAVLRKLASVLLARYDGFMLHAATVVYNGNAYAFVAPSGTGKTTHCRLWLDMFGDNAFILNGDKQLIRKQGGHFVAYGNPWNGKEGYGEAGCYPLGGVFLLRRAAKNSLSAVDATEALAALMSAAAVTKSKDARLRMLELLTDLIETVTVHALYANMQPDAVLTALSGLEEST